METVIQNSMVPVTTKQLTWIINEYSVGSSHHLPMFPRCLRHEVLSSCQVAGHGVVFDEALDLATDLASGPAPVVTRNGEVDRNGELRVSMVYLWYIYGISMVYLWCILFSARWYVCIYIWCVSNKWCVLSTYTVYLFCVLWYGI